MYSAGLGITTRGRANGAWVVIQGPTEEPEPDILSTHVFYGNTTEAAGWRGAMCAI